VFLVGVWIEILEHVVKQNGDASRVALVDVRTELVGLTPIRLRCRACGTEWMPLIEADGRIRPDEWACNAVIHGSAPSRRRE
jgi:hypothetical protein